MKWIDIPPVWLGLALLASAALAQVQPAALALRLPVLGTGLVGVGLVLMALAAFAMWRARTTIVPHMAPQALVTGGIFGFSRNPIYLGDALILAGLALRWGVPVALLLVPLFMAVITRRFIRDEEDRLHRHFGAAFTAYAARVRRWL